MAPTYLGAAFQPYVAQWTGDSPQARTPPWNSYSQQDIARMLETIAPSFDKISTYGMGYAGYYRPATPWNQVDSNCYVAGAAAQVNQQQGKMAIEVSQGIYQQPTPDLQLAEIAAAFAAAQAANSLSANRVTTLVFTNEYVTDATTTSTVTAMLAGNRPRANDLNLKVGVRSQTFGQLTNPACPYLVQLQSLVGNCDVILCNLYPPNPPGTIQESVQSVAQSFDSIRAAVAGLNPQCEVMIGETGWPSAGISFNNSVNNVTNAKAYFAAMKQWAALRNVMTYYFEAIDEPWKSNRNASVPPTAPWQGPNGAEGHYGIWYLDAGHGYVPKFSAS
jgi:glucan 1,3-beta-glucosidase